jgi:hypothetical protein
MTAIGNHEARTNSAQPYLDNLILPTSVPDGNERFYAFEAGPALFVSLDVHTSSFAPGSPQHTWLEETLASSNHVWKFAFLHSGPYSCSRVHGSNLPVRQSFSPLFERYGMDVVFSGHDHGYERSKPVRDFVPDGYPVRYVVSGGGGRSLYPWSTSCPWTASASSAYQLATVSVEGPCLSLIALRPDGSVLDSEAYCKRAPAETKDPQPPAPSAPSPE